MTSLAWYAELGRRHELLSGMVPQISIILGKCAGGAVYSPIQTDLLVAVRDQGYLFVTGPDVIQEVTGEEVSLDELGGADAQARYGNIHQVVESEAAAFHYVRDYLSFLPSNCFDEAPIVNPGLEPEITPTDLELDSIVPDSDNMAYDMHEILLRIFDDGDFLDVAAQGGPAIITGFARVDGRPVGVVANQPMHLSGAIDNEASDKAARFIRFCDSFEIPLVFVVDTPGFLPGAEQEKNGIIKRGGRFLYAVVEADVPKVTITIRKSYGGAYAVMGSRQLTADFNFAWPTARIAVIGAEGAAQLLMKRFPDPTAPEAQQIKKDFIEGYNLNMAIPWIAAERGFIDAVIDPHQTRLLIRRSLHLLRDKQLGPGWLASTACSRSSSTGEQTPNAQFKRNWAPSTLLGIVSAPSTSSSKRSSASSVSASMPRSGPRRPGTAARTAGRRAPCDRCRGFPAPRRPAR